MFKSILAIIANVTGMIFRRQVDKNAEDVKEAKKRQDAVNERSKDADVVVKRDEEEFRKRISE